jgi:hypothetical protein
MTTAIPQSILEALTNVSMPRHVKMAQPQQTLDVEGYRIPVYHSEALVVGSGAAGLRAAVELRAAKWMFWWRPKPCSGERRPVPVLINRPCIPPRPVSGR